MPFPFPVPRSMQVAGQQRESQQILGAGESNIANRLGPILDSKNQHGAPDLPFINTAIEAVDPGTRALAGLRSATQNKQIATREARNVALGDDLSFADAEEDLTDFGAERAAGRQMLPSASALHQRQRGEATEDAYSRYVAPAEIRAGADIDAAGIAGESRIQAAQRSANGVRDAAATRAGGPEDWAVKALLDAVANGKSIPQIPGVDTNKLLASILSGAR